MQINAEGISHNEGLEPFMHMLPGLLSTAKPVCACVYVCVCLCVCMCLCVCVAVLASQAV
jgi:hypothetical protein